MAKKMKSPSTSYYNKNELISLQIDAGAKLDELLDCFGLSLKKSHKFYSGVCPVHGGDNDAAFNIFHSGEIIGNWRCFTHNCHNHFQPSIIGFVRGVISRSKYGWSSIDDDAECPFMEAVEFIKNFTGNKKYKNIDFQTIEKKNFISHINDIYARDEPEKVLKVKRENVIKSLNIPSPYFMSRGFSKEVLIKYDVGCCNTKGK